MSLIRNVIQTWLDNINILISSPKPLFLPYAQKAYCVDVCHVSLQLFYLGSHSFSPGKKKWRSKMLLSTHTP